MVVPRLSMRLMGDREGLPLGEAIWGDTRVELPRKMSGGVFQSMMDARQITASADEEVQFVPVATLFAMWPCALLANSSRASCRAGRLRPIRT